MADVFISYAHTTANQAQGAAAVLRALGYSVWLDDDLAAHRAFTHAIEEQLTAAKAALVIWSADAAKSEWVLSEANRAREDRKLVQLTIDKTRLPMPFDQLQCADLSGWTGEGEHPNWRRVIASVAELVRGATQPVAISFAEASAPTLPDKPSIAVLPFADMTGSKDQDYFADGMVEEIVTALSRFQSLFVIASGSSLSYRDGARNLKQIARELGVRYLLEGSVRKAADRVRISVKLTDAVEGAPLWTERFDGTLEDVFALQDTVANSVAGQIEPTVEAAEIRRANARPTSDLGAYDLYLRALQLMHSFEKTAMLQAIDVLDQAMARDPDYSLVQALAGYLRSMMFVFAWSNDPADTRRSGLELAERALRSGSEDPQVLTYVAETIANLGGDLTISGAMLERSLVRNPGAAMSWAGSGWLQIYAGRPELAGTHFDTAIRLDPRSPYRHVILAGIGWSLLALRRFSEALPALREAVQLRPGNAGAWAALAASLAHLGDLSEARSALEHLDREAFDSMLGVFRDPEHRELLRSGLALAGADV